MIHTLASNHLRRFLQFAVIGGSVFVFGAALLGVLVEHVRLPETTAYTLQLVISVLLTFYLSMHITWRDRLRRPAAMWRFGWARIMAALLAWVLYAVMVKLGVHYQIANIISVAVTTLINYVVADKWVFRSTHREREFTDIAALRLDGWDVVKSVAFIAVVVTTIYLYEPAMFASLLLTAVAIVATLLAVMSIIGVLYAYKDPQQPDRLRLPSPDGQCGSKIAILMPARHEVSVLPFTMLTAAWTQREHTSFGVFAVVCDDDVETRRVALTAAHVINAGINRPDVTYEQLERELQSELTVPYDDGSEVVEGIVKVLAFPLGRQKPSKPKQLNYAFELLKDNYDVFTILDAESLAREGLLMHVDRALRDNPDCTIIQCGVQLMPPIYHGPWYRRLSGTIRGWYRWHNLLEYYRWFSGQMRFQSDSGFMPLGGNTVFVRTSLLEKTNGWPDELTEDCALGALATSVYGAKTMTFYDPKLTTLEETPGTLQGFIKQRVRWNQGFLQTFIGGVWRALPGFLRRLIALWILSVSFFQASAAVFMPITLATMVALKSPPILVLMMYTPIVAMVLTVGLQVVQLQEFGQVYGHKIRWYIYVLFVLTNPLYQMLLSYAAARAVVRHMRGDTSWHKTEHSGDHIGLGVPAPALAPERGA